MSQIFVQLSITTLIRRFIAQTDSVLTISEHVFVRRRCSGQALVRDRLNRRPRLAPDEAGFISGLIDAEGSFAITKRNGISDWGCYLAIAMRADDGDLLVRILEQTDLGQLNVKPARATSKPQVVWTVHAQPECIEVVRILRVCPLRGRKRAEFEVWAQAVEALTDPTRRAELLPWAFEEIRRLRRYVNPDEREDVSRPRPLLEHPTYVGGFLTGEAHLQLSMQYCRLAVHLRADDKPLLEMMAAESGLGRIYDLPAYGTGRPSATWIVSRRDQLEPAVALLEAVGLRGRKAREFAAWRHAAREFASAAAAGRRRNRAAVARLQAELAHIRRYEEPKALELPRTSAAEVFAQTCLTALEETARATIGPVTTAAYEQLRRENPHWPNRDTIVRVFGSWRIAATGGPRAPAFQPGAIPGVPAETEGGHRA